MNVLPNCNWQMMTNIGYGRGIIYQGTDIQPQINFTSFTPNSNTPTFLTTNTWQLYPGCLVTIPIAGLDKSALRVSSVVTNTSFTVTLPFDDLSPVSGSGTATPLGRGDLLGGSTGALATGWNKDLGVVSWVDDFAVNRCVGAKRVMGLRKTSSSVQVGAYHDIPSSDIPAYAGRPLVFGALVSQKVQGGAGTWYLTINDGVSISTSSLGAGSSYSDPRYGTYQFLTATKVISPNATILQVILYLAGASGDVYYLALPTAKVGSPLTADDCGQNPQEVLSCGHWNPPLLTPLTRTFPSAAYSGTGGLLFGYSGKNCDLEALSFGAMHKSVRAVKTKIELTTPTPGLCLFTGSSLDAPEPLLFGPQQYTQIAGATIACQGWLPLDKNGNAALFLNQPSGVVTNATFDFDDVQL